MLSSVLRSARAVRVNIEIMRTFVRLRQMLEANARIAIKVYELERSCDSRFAAVFEAIRDLTARPPAPAARRIGFATPSESPTARTEKRERPRQRALQRRSMAVMRP